MSFIHGFLQKKGLDKGFEWIAQFYKKLKSISKISDKALAQIFLAINGNKEVWDFISTTPSETQYHFWSKVHSGIFCYDKETISQFVEKLIEHKRFISAVNSIYYFANELSTGLLVNVLTHLATEKSEEENQLHSYSISRIFEVLDKRTDIKHDDLIRLEWFYLQILASENTGRNPKLLHNELASNPKFFNDIIEISYLPKGSGKTDSEISQEERERIMQAFKLLDTWKTIPCTDNSGKINKDSFSMWIKEVRTRGVETGRLEAVDMHIGQVLAQFSEKEGNIPPAEVCDVIENINTKRLKDGFYTALCNKRSFSRRSAFAGGDIERDHASFFEKLANKFKISHPYLSDVFQDLKQKYLHDAKIHDEMAKRDELDC